MDVVLSNEILCQIVMDNNFKDSEDLFKHLDAMNNFSAQFDEQQLRHLKSKLTFFMTTFLTKFRNSQYVVERFLRTHVKWLQRNFVFSVEQKQSGRPSLDSFDHLSTSTKRRRIISLRESHAADVIEMAFLENLKLTGKKEVAKQIAQLLQSSKQDEESLHDTNEDGTLSFNNDEALALYEDAKLTKHQYQTIRFRLKDKGADILPPYGILLEAKNKCCPDSLNLQITETFAEVKLQKLLDITVSRLILDPTNSEAMIKSKNTPTLTLTTKWGCDGSSGLSEYKQRFSDDQSSDASVFMTSMVPLSLKVDGTDKIIWENPHPASTRYCRPIKFEFAKETKEKVLSEVNSIKNEITNLIPTEIKINNINYIVNHKMCLTMADGKICQYVTETISAAVCYVCGAYPREMNDLDAIKDKAEKIENLEYGLATLHAWIRSMECLLHISYCLEIEKGVVRADIDKEKKKSKKAKVQREFRARMGLIVDVPKQGSGTSNDGNTARRFFCDPQLTAEITGISEELIRRLHTILQAITCGYKIDVLKFKEYCFETAKLYVDLYPWYKMPSSLHKLLIHGWRIIEVAALPIGQLTEEAQEALNKLFKRIREFNTRKCSREATNQDLFRKLLVSSDPFINSLRNKWKKKPSNIDHEAQNLLDLT